MHEGMGFLLFVMETQPAIMGLVFSSVDSNSKISIKNLEKESMDLVGMN
jgi:hypothetical protein